MAGSNKIFILLLVVAILIVVYFVWRHFVKPYALKWDHTLAIVGGLGSGKTLLSVKQAMKMYKRSHRSWRIECLKCDFHNWLVKHGWIPSKNPKALIKHHPEEPMFYSNIPVILKKGFRKKSNVYSCRLTKGHITFKYRIPENSVVLIDEFQQFIDQFHWGDSDVQGVANEFITYFRHYTNGGLITNTQADSQIVKDWRVKFSTFYRIFDHNSYFNLVYKIDVVRCVIGDVQVADAGDFLDDHAKSIYGFYFPRRYDSRCYRHRYDKVALHCDVHFKELTTNKILRFSGVEYKSPLDDAEGSING